MNTNHPKKGRFRRGFSVSTKRPFAVIRFANLPARLRTLRHAILDRMESIFRTLPNWLRWLTEGASVLVVGLCLLLFVQWPLRDWFQAYSRQANDVGQILFSIYASVALTAASLTKNHLAITKHDIHVNKVSVTWRSWALLLCVGPWALFLIWTAVPQMLVSVAQLEAFSEGNTPGYFILRIALVLLGGLVLFEAVHRAFASPLRPAINAS